jgi:hypothetical protein
MSNIITSIEALVDELGGNTVLGCALGITPEAVANWKARGSIPTGWHWRLLAMARKRGKHVAPSVFGIDDDVAADLPELQSA